MSTHEKRNKASRFVMRKVASNIFKDGKYIRVTLMGERDTVGSTDFHRSITSEFWDDSTCADEINWDVYSDKKATPENHIGSALLVHGNDGYDVIADYNMSLDSYMPTGNEMDYAESLVD